MITVLGLPVLSQATERMKIKEFFHSFYFQLFGAELPIAKCNHVNDPMKNGKNIRLTGAISCCRTDEQG